MSAATVGLGLDYCRDADGRPLLLTAAEDTAREQAVRAAKKEADTARKEKALERKQAARVAELRKQNQVRQNSPTANPLASC